MVCLGPWKCRACRQCLLPGRRVPRRRDGNQRTIADIIAAEPWSYRQGTNDKEFGQIPSAWPDARINEDVVKESGVDKAHREVRHAVSFTAHSSVSVYFCAHRCTCLSIIASTSMTSKVSLIVSVFDPGPPPEMLEIWPVIESAHVRLPWSGVNNGPEVLGLDQLLQDIGLGGQR